MILVDVEKTAGISGCTQAAEDLLHHDGAVPLPPAVRAAVEGDQLPPGGQVGGAEIADGAPVILKGGALMKHLVDAREERHFQDMSLLHALGWRAAYRDSIPADYMSREITDGHSLEGFAIAQVSQSGFL